MRKILFRGKAQNRKASCEYRTNYKNGDWVYGFLTDSENFMGFAVMTNENGISGIDVDKETVGQYIGKNDKNDKLIFEGDILSGAWNTLLLVYYDEASTSFLVKDCNGHSSPIDYYDNNRIEIVGNIHDTPELMKGGVKDNG